MSNNIHHKEISSEILQAIGFIAVVAGNIEHFLEDTILAIEKEPLAGVKPSTDLVPVSKLINRFNGLANAFTSPALKQIAQSWCNIASEAFICRNSILHGRSMVWDADNLDFITNTSYNQEIRKFTSKTFIANIDSARLLADVFELLAQVITAFMFMVRGKISEQQLINAVSLAKLKNAASTIHELANLVDYYNHEKY
jgi:hypothetical protein